MLEEHTIRYIPIVENKEILGMWSYSDLLKVGYAVENDDDKNIKFSVFDRFTIKQVLAKDLYFVITNSTVKEVE